MHKPGAAGFVLGFLLLLVGRGARRIGIFRFLLFDGGRQDMEHPALGGKAGDLSPKSPIPALELAAVLDSQRSMEDEPGTFGTQIYDGASIPFLQADTGLEIHSGHNSNLEFGRHR